MILPKSVSTNGYKVPGSYVNQSLPLEESGSTNGIILTSRACVAPYGLGFIQRACELGVALESLQGLRDLT